MMKSYYPILFLILFEAIAVSLWLILDHIFYLFNFSYIGICLSLGLFFYQRKYKFARRFVQFAVGTYMFFYLGVLSRENMQIEGFWYYLFLGVFEAAVIHYVVAKIFGPLLFGRGWCGYACWTAMILDLLPFKTPSSPRKPFGFIRYVLFLLSFLFVGALFVLQIPDLETIMFYSFLIGNALYYLIGIILAFVFKDNRAFCKYICPVAVVMKPAAKYSYVRVKVDPDLCVSCGKCLKVCPMNVDLLNLSRNRENGSECILCFRCAEECPKDAIH